MWSVGRGVAVINVTPNGGVKSDVVRHGRLMLVRVTAKARRWTKIADQDQFIAFLSAASVRVKASA
jgi:hypothetical protein